MIDIVEQLQREYVRRGLSCLQEAADEIERLRGLLREWLADVTDTDELMTSGDMETLVERTRMAITVRQSNDSLT